MELASSTAGSAAKPCPRLGLQLKTQDWPYPALDCKAYSETEGLLCDDVTRCNPMLRFIRLVVVFQGLLLLSGNKSVRESSERSPNVYLNLMFACISVFKSLLYACSCGDPFGIMSFPQLHTLTYIIMLHSVHSL